MSPWALFSRLCAFSTEKKDYPPQRELFHRMVSISLPCSCKMRITVFLYYFAAFIPSAYSNIKVAKVAQAFVYVYSNSEENEKETAIKLRMLLRGCFGEKFLNFPFCWTEHYARKRRKYFRSHIFISLSRHIKVLFILRSPSIIIKCILFYESASVWRKIEAL